MFEKFFSLFSHVKSGSLEGVKNFSDAYDWILTYKKAKEYQTGIMAARELLLKIKSSILYYSNAEKKFTTLAGSNIEDIAKSARQKQRIIEQNLKEFYKWETKLHKLILSLEKLAAEIASERDQERLDAEITKEIREIEDLFGKKDFSWALHHAKKLASTHYQSRRATEILLKAQKQYDKSIRSEKKGEVSDRKMERFLREMGVKMPQENPSNDQNKQESLFTAKLAVIQKIQEIWKSIKEKQKERENYVKNQQVLRRVETMLLETGSIANINNTIENESIISIMESGLTKNITDFKLDGYNFFGKIIGKDKIVGDTFGSYKNGNNSIFYFGDATGHWVQAGFTVSMLTKIFFEQTKRQGFKDSFEDTYLKINNELKGKLKGRVFVTAVMFKYDSTNGRLEFLGAGHDPMYIYRHATRTVEKIIPGGLALGVRLINNISSVKSRTLELAEHDMLIGYTDGILESRNAQWELYGLPRLEKAIARYAPNAISSPDQLFEGIMKDVAEFQWGEIFLDDVSMFIFERNPNADLITDKAGLDNLLKDLDTSDRAVKIDYKGKTREQILADVQAKHHQAELKARMTILEQLYKLGEYPRLKQEIAACYKQNLIHERMQFFLKKIIKNEDKVKTMKLEDRLQKKYEMLKDLYEKGEYSVVIREAVDVIYKNGNI